MKYNMKLTATYIKTKENGIADALSRYQMERFRRLAPQAKPNLEEPPDYLKKMS